ncbi:MAG TPA: hypothetical protein PK854_10820, partial [Oscillospiraceae bacterium]|nr:hypothetical protein [Oscillospiraceae bacterium]
MKTLSKIGVILLSLMLVFSFATMALSAVPANGKPSSETSSESSATGSAPSVLDDIVFLGKTDNPDPGEYGGADIVVFKKGADKFFICINASLQSVFSGVSTGDLVLKLASFDPSLNGAAEVLYYTSGTTGSYYNSQEKVTATFTFTSNDGDFTISVGSMSHFDLFA